MFENVELEIELVDQNAKMPTRAHQGDAGMDVYTPDDIKIPRWSSTLIPLGWRCSFPEGYALKVVEKSGIAVKKGLDVGANLVDSLYRGIVHVHLFNNTDEDVYFLRGEKIAQMILIPVWAGQPKRVNKISTDTDRGEGGFGSTGSK